MHTGGENVPGDSVFKGLLPNVKSPSLHGGDESPRMWNHQWHYWNHSLPVCLSVFLIVTFTKETPPLADFFFKLTRILGYLSGPFSLFTY